MRICVSSLVVPIRLASGLSYAVTQALLLLTYSSREALPK